jgi:hypothetical protein
MIRRKVRFQPNTRLNLESLEDRLAAGSLIPFTSLTPPPYIIMCSVIHTRRLRIN